MSIDAKTLRELRAAVEKMITTLGEDAAVGILEDDHPYRNEPEVISDGLSLEAVYLTPHQVVKRLEKEGQMARRGERKAVLIHY